MMVVKLHGGWGMIVIMQNNIHIRWGAREWGNIGKKSGGLGSTLAQLPLYRDQLRVRAIEF